MELFQRAGGGLAAASIVMRPNDEKTEATDVAAAYQHDCLAHGQLMVAVWSTIQLGQTGTMMWSCERKLVAEWSWGGRGVTHSEM